MRWKGDVEFGGAVEAKSGGVAKSELGLNMERRLGGWLGTSLVVKCPRAPWGGACCFSTILRPYPH